MTKYLLLLTFLITVFSCSSDNGDKFIGEWQSTEKEKRVYTITKINDNNYLVKWNSYSFGGSGGSFPIPPQYVSGGEFNANYANGNLEVMNTPAV